MFDLITGHQGLPHITAEQVSTINDIFMYGYGENTIVRLLDGTISQDGRAIVISEGYWRANGYDMQITEDETIAFDPTEAGVSRIDVVYAEILQDIPTGNQRTEFVVIQGTPGAYPVEPPVPSAAPLTTDDLILAIPVAKCTISENLMTFVDQTIPLSDGNVEDINEQLEAIRNIYGAKNLLKNTGQTTAQDGLTFTVADNGEILVTGTSSNLTFFYIHLKTDESPKLKAGTKLHFSCMPEAKNDVRVLLRFECTDGSMPEILDVGNGGDRTLTKDVVSILCAIQIFGGVYMGPDGMTFSPMLCVASMYDGVFRPYARTNEDLTSDVGSLRHDLGIPSAYGLDGMSAFGWINNLINQKNNIRSDLGYKTDAASSTGSAFARIAALNSALSYSTSEVVIGSYLGKPLYRKTYRGTLSNYVTNSRSVVIFDTQPTFRIVKRYGWVEYSSGRVPIPYTYPGATTEQVFDVYQDYNDGGLRFVYYSITSAYNNQNYEITIEYTKTTD